MRLAFYGSLDFGHEDEESPQMLIDSVPRSRLVFGRQGWRWQTRKFDRASAAAR